MFSKGTQKIQLSGFTLVELLVVMGILATLLTIVLVAINPGRQFAQANNTQRQSNVNAILNAINGYMADNRGNPPPGITTTTSTIKAAGANICASIVPTYISAMPVDPTAGSYTDCTTYDTEYTVVRTATSTGSRITVAAPSAELSQTISVTR